MIDTNEEVIFQSSRNTFRGKETITIKYNYGYQRGTAYNLLAYDDKVIVNEEFLDTVPTKEMFESEEDTRYNMTSLLKTDVTLGYKSLAGKAQSKSIRFYSKGEGQVMKDIRYVIE